MVAQRPLEPPVQVRVLAPQPHLGARRSAQHLPRRPAEWRGPSDEVPVRKVVDDGLGARARPRQKPPGPLGDGAASRAQAFRIVAPPTEATTMAAVNQYARFIVVRAPGDR